MGSKTATVCCINGLLDMFSGFANCETQMELKITADLLRGYFLGYFAGMVEKTYEA